jgi:hypothetical protein
LAGQDKQGAAPGPARSSWRLTFRYDGPRIELIDRRQVQMIPPPVTGSRPIAGQHAGTWLELRDTGDQVLYHRDLSRLMGAEVEAFEPDGTIRHVVGTPGRGQFEVVVPDVPAAASVCVVSSPFEGKARQEAAREVARFPLRPAGRGKEDRE